VPNYTKDKETTGRTNERVCCSDRLYSDDKSKSLFSFFEKKMKVATKRKMAQ